MIETQGIESPFTPSQRIEWLQRMSSSGEFCDHMFLQLTATVLDRNIQVTRVISDEIGQKSQIL